MNHTAKQILEAVQKANTLLLIPHQNPDGDALGASSAFGLWLTSMRKDFYYYCKTNASPRFSYLPIEKLTTDQNIWEQPFDVIIVFDSGDLRYAGVDEQIAKIRKNVTVINIDHHATNEYFGDLNFVDIKASSTSEMVQRFFAINHISLQKEIATSLLTGFITDTDNFTNAATSSFALSSVSNLIKNGGNMVPIQNRVYKNISIPALKVWGSMLSRLSHEIELDSIYTYISLTDIEGAQIAESDIEGLANFMNMIEDGKTKIILKEIEPNYWKGSFRTTRDDHDVSAFAKALGGGGHKKAAGFKVQGDKDQAFRTIFSVIKNQQDTKI